MKRKWIKYTIGGLLICIGLWALLLAIAFFYIRSNKQKILNGVQADLSEKISGQITFNDLSADFFENFPGISVALTNVSVKDSLFSIHKHELLNVQHVYVGFGILDILTGKKVPKYVTLQNGKIYLFADSAGHRNWNIFKKQPGKGNFDLKKVIFKNIEAIFEDEGKFKFYDLWFTKMKCAIDTRDQQWKFKMSNEAVIKNASFNTRVGSYLSNKKLIANWIVLYDNSSKQISLARQPMRVDNHLYRISGNFMLGKAPIFNLSIETDNLLLKEAASIFPLPTQEKINKYSLSKPIRGIKAFLSGPMEYLTFPVVKVYFSANDASLDFSTVQFQHCSFHGLFNNVADSSKQPSDENSVIDFTQVKGEWEKNSFDCQKISFYNLIRTYVKCDVHFLFKLPQLDKAIASRRLDLNAGDGEAKLDFSGPVNRSDSDYILNGTVSIHDGDITYNPRDLHFQKTTIELAFQNGQVLIKRMNTTINNNNISINGSIKNFINFFNADSSKTDFEWKIYSPHLDIGKLSSSLHRTVSSKKKNTYTFFEKLNNKIDKLFDDCNAYITIKADKIVYRNFSATNLSGKLALSNDKIILNNISLSHAGGNILVNASSRDNGNNSDLALQSKMQNVNIKELFAAFNNFGMQSLTSKNIDGRFSADISLTSMLDANNNLYKPANRGSVDFSLQDGKLQDFKPLMEIDNNFLQKRDLSNIEFAELRDRFDLDGNDIKVNRMEIRSTAVDMYVEGVYSFANNTDLSIQIPLHNQKKDPGVVPEKKGNDSKGGMSVFLRAKDDKDGKLKISYDLLGRFRNKK